MLTSGYHIEYDTLSMIDFYNLSFTKTILRNIFKRSFFSYIIILSYFPYAMLWTRNIYCYANI